MNIPVEWPYEIQRKHEGVWTRATLLRSNAHISEHLKYIAQWFPGEEVRLIHHTATVIEIPKS